MNVTTLTTPREVAREKLAEYRQALGRRASEEYAAAAAIYEQQALGRAVLLLSQVIAEAPRDDRIRPRLAIARADRREVRYTRYRDSTVGESFDTYLVRRSGPAPRDSRIVVPVGPTTPPLPAGDRGWMVEGFALVPMVPPDVARGHDLSKRYILWEVEAWADRPRTMQPDRDPYLLLRIAPDAFAVVGEWDLTEVERAVMRGRLGSS